MSDKEIEKLKKVLKPKEDKSCFSIQLVGDPIPLVAEDLIDAYIKGNLDQVKKALEAAPPIRAAVVAIDLYRMIIAAGTPENPSASEYMEHLRRWQP